MRAIISPAKNMSDRADAAAWSDLPVYLDRAEVLKDWICGLSYAEQKGVYAKMARSYNSEAFIASDDELSVLKFYRCNDITELYHCNDRFTHEATRAIPWIAGHRLGAVLGEGKPV